MQTTISCNPWWRWIALLLVAVPRAAAYDDPQKPEANVRQQQLDAGSLAARVGAIKVEYQQRERQFEEELRAAKHDHEKIARSNEEFQQFTSVQAAKLTRLIRNNGKDPAALEGILVLVEQLGYFLNDEQVELVLVEHLTDPRMGRLCFAVSNRNEPWVEQILQATAARHPERNARAQATYALGDYWRNRALPYGRDVPAAGRAQWLAEAAKQYTEVRQTYTAVPTPDGHAKLGDKAAAELRRIENLSRLEVGRPAPEIEGEDTDSVRFKLSDYRGKVVLLDFWGHW